MPCSGRGLGLRDLRCTIGIARDRKVYGVGMQLVLEQEPRPASESLATLP